MEKMVFIPYNLLRNITLPFNYFSGKVKYLSIFSSFDIGFKLLLIITKWLCLFNKFPDL